MSTSSTTVDLEHRLARVRTGLRRIAHTLAGPGAAPDLVAAAYDTLASVASVESALLRGEEPLR